MVLPFMKNDIIKSLSPDIYIFIAVFTVLVNGFQTMSINHTR